MASSSDDERGQRASSPKERLHIRYGLILHMSESAAVIKLFFRRAFASKST